MKVLCEERSHVVQYELAGMAVLSGVVPRTVHAPEGRLTPEAIQAAVKPRAYYRSDLTTVVLENTHSVSRRPGACGSNSAAACGRWACWPRPGWWRSRR